MTQVIQKSFRYVTFALFFYGNILLLEGKAEVSMFNKEKILEILNQEDTYIDNFILEAFIKNWKIDPIYEDAQGVEYFDEMAIEKIRNGLKQKNPPKINVIDKNTIKPVDISVEAPMDDYEPQTEIESTPVCHPQVPQEIVKEEHVELPIEVKKRVDNELQNVTIDISNQTLAILAESIAKKITSDVADFIKKTDFTDGAVQLGEYKKDNQILAQKIDELMTDNKILVQRIDELEKENQSFNKIFGNIYLKS